MDLDAWRPEDTARRLALLLAGSLGTFAFIALWLALGWPLLPALLAGAVVGALLRLTLYGLLLLVFRR